MALPAPTAIDPQIQAIFDATQTYMTANSLPSCNSYVTKSGSGTNMGISCITADGNTYNYTYFVKGVQVLVTPTGATAGPAETVQFTATAQNADGSTVAGATFTWKAGVGTISATGLYTAPATIAANIPDTVTCTLSDGSAWSTVTIQLHT